ncbi:MAG: Asp-tRNA(Asn)/Glu-tRNA(Gln) amidotransferase GatCAB subunit B, partial [Fimbriimonadaceae bacterium]
ARHADQLISDKEWAEYFEEGVALGGEPQTICNWMIADLSGYLNENGLSARQSNITPAHLVDLTRLISEGVISGKMGKDVFAESVKTGEMPSDVVRSKGLSQVSDTGEIEIVAKQIIGENPEVVDRYKSGQLNVKGFLVGLTMKAGQGKFNPGIVQDAVQKALDEVE